MPRRQFAIRLWFEIGRSRVCEPLALAQGRLL